jgi:hypothetical protein
MRTIAYRTLIRTCLDMGLMLKTEPLFGSEE